MLIDAQAHIFPRIWGLNATGPTRGGGYGRIRIGDNLLQLLPPFQEKTVFTVEMLIKHMDWAGVDKAILLQGPFYGECNAYAAEAITQYPDRLIGAAYFDPWTSDSRQIFEQKLDLSCFRAMKLECSEATGLCGLHPQARLDAPDITWLWPELEKLQKVLVLDLGAVGSRSYQTRAVRRIAETHPDLRVVIAHLGQPTPVAEADAYLWQLWRDQISLGHLPNVWFDIAALPAYLPNEIYPYPSMERYLQLAFERIGPTKILWGTDLPGLLSHATYQQLVQLAEYHTRSLTSAEQELVLGGNASHIF